jgi:MoxR-like ATPase
MTMESRIDHTTHNAKVRAVHSASETIDAMAFSAAFESIVENIETVIKGKTEVVRLALVAILCEGHILFEDVPGTGKSMLARAIAQSINATSNRVQCTPDMLPGDITGSSILDQKQGTFEFRPGPIFTNVLLSDEINRATPKTQSALLEAMAERRVSTDGVTRDLPRPFLVLATQNPVELAGTFPLPEAQLDRFLFKLSMGYMSRDTEFEVMFDNSVQLSIEDLGAVIDTHVVRAMIEYASQVDISPEVGYYIVDLVPPGKTRRWPWAEAPGPASPSCVRRGAWPPPTGGSTSTPTTCGPCSGPSWPTGSCSTPTPCCGVTRSMPCWSA